jgi:hypothetical protein
VTEVASRRTDQRQSASAATVQSAKYKAARARKKGVLRYACLCSSRCCSCSENVDAGSVHGYRSPRLSAIGMKQTASTGITLTRHSFRRRITAFQLAPTTYVVRMNTSAPRAIDVT